MGALIGGFTSLQGIYRSRIAVVFAVTLGIAISSFLGALAAPSLPALIVLTIAVGYFYGTIAQFGMPAGVAALNTTVAFVIFSSLPLTPRQDFEQSSLLFLGGMIQVVLLMLAWPLDRSAIERRGLAAAYRDLADLRRLPRDRLHRKRRRLPRSRRPVRSSPINSRWRDRATSLATSAFSPKPKRFATGWARWRCWRQRIPHARSCKNSRALPASSFPL